ncbi:PQQ-dependent sugar dehydrogenase [Sphingopyxis terrae]|uniref:Glucose/arabinose dehydrogenase, beta-propeller fold n=2 Tax=Sphingopyxis TaxID=165697 RepID=A0A1Y6EEY1_9SPHN|nr:sorbosone dehydrogenase family protein [Sphingopyxis terrae]PCF93164.1 sorbosone dehydrogenase [Sphingopyxis terrae subsp. ummariensis]SMQ61135.1 Glucose/arabinose dehydrogenase, beta-propeller fold [Sphingopyxis terrae subsp. ummariensis]
MRKILKYVAIALVVLIVAGGIAFYVASRPDIARFSTAELSGRVPVMASQRPEQFPTMKVLEATGWPAGEAPRAADGLTVARFAEGLDHPRSMLVLPNGDVLVAEAQSPPRKDSGIEGKVMKSLMGKAGAGGPSANRITLLRDANGDGKAEVKTAYITGLNSPYGMALVGKTLYVADTDALLAFPFVEGATAMAGKPTKIVDLPAQGTNRHWTKSLVAAPNGWLYIGVGADSNIGEKGMGNEVRRARILEVRPENKYMRTYAAGIRNPVGLAFYPGSNTLWTVVNERDMLGSDLVPDYLTDVDEGDFFGWPWYYWGGFTDPRVAPEAEDRRQYVKRPQYALGAHVAPLGMTFTNGLDLGDRWANGALIALHGSWNRDPVSGYDVVFVKFGDNGKPLDALPVTLLDQFVAKDGKTTRGRPADVKVAKDGSALVADDTGGIIWRVAKAG